MKCLIINHTPIEGSGSGTYVLSIAKHLKALGVQPIILTLDKTENQFFVENDILCITSKLSLSGCEDGEFPSFTGHPKSSLCYNHLKDRQLKEYRDQLLKVVQNIIEQYRVDLVHAQHLFLIASLAQEIEVPMVVTSHGSEFHFLRSYPDHLACAWMKESLHHVSEVFFISKFVYNIFLQCGLTLLYPPQIIYSGFDQQIFNLKSTPVSEPYSPLLLAVGRFVRYKRFDVYLRAIPLIRRKYPSLHAALIGNGPLYEELKPIALQSDVQMVGYLPTSDVAQWLHNADLLIMPSEHEPFGLIALESLACGVPVIGSNSGGLPEIVNDSVGKLVAGWDPLHWAEMIISSLNEHAEYKKSFFNERAKNFTWNKTVQQLVAGYKRSLNRKMALTY